MTIVMYAWENLFAVLLPEFDPYPHERTTKSGCRYLKRDKTSDGELCKSHGLHMAPSWDLCSYSCLRFLFLEEVPVRPVRNGHTSLISLAIRQHGIAMAVHFTCDVGT